MSGPGSGKIAFVSNRDGNLDIYALDSDGSNLTRLTDDPSQDVNPIWSPDGSRIAFLSARDSASPNRTYGIYVMDADGSEVKRVSPAGGDYRNRNVLPNWSSDGSSLTFPACQEDDCGIFEFDLANSYLTNVTDSPEFLLPVVSPDGSRVLFVSHRDRDGDSPIGLYVANVDGSDWVRVDPRPELEEPVPSPEVSPGIQAFRQTLLTDPFAWGGGTLGAWSPDGQRLALTLHYGDSEVYLVDADGSGFANLTDNPADDLSPVWSPDGTHIAFVSDRNDEFAIYVMEADGSNLTHVANDAVFPAWSPDGSGLAFVSDRDGNLEIYVADTDGSNLTRLTDHTEIDTMPAWSPVP